MSSRRVPVIEAKKTSKSDMILDPAGFVVIEVYDGAVHVEFYENVMREGKIVSGKLCFVVEGFDAAALCDSFAFEIGEKLRPEHLLYVGREIQRACDSLKNGCTFVQDGC